MNAEPDRPAPGERDPDDAPDANAAGLAGDGTQAKEDPASPPDPKTRPTNETEDEKNESEETEENEDDDSFAESERDWLRRDDGLRDYSIEAGRDVIGRLSNRVDGGGGINQAGRDVNISLGAVLRAEPAYITREWADKMTAFLAEPPSLTPLSRHLESRDLVFLIGAEGTGRKTAAIAALLGWVRGRGGSAEEIGIIRGLGTFTAAALPKLRLGNGYVVDWDFPDWSAHVGYLEDLAMQSKARLVVLVPRSRADLPHLTVEHRPPRAVEVFGRRLEYEARLAGVDAELPEETWTWVTEKLSGEREPRRAADMASRFVAGRKEGLSLKEIIEAEPDILYEHFRGLLDKDAPILGRCFTVASAVLNGLAEATVSQAAIDLSDRIHEAWQVKQEDRERPAWTQLNRWLEHAGASVQVSPGRRTVGLGRDRAAGVVTKVFWEEHTAAREPLIEWLLALAANPDPVAQVRVAYAVGTLARLDIDAINKRFLDGWARSRLQRDHRLAALALEALAQDQRMRLGVHARLRNLARSERYGPRAVAVQAYGFRIRIAVDEALSELRQLSTVPVVRLNRAAARSIGYLYTADTARTVLRELARWVDDGSDGGRRTAALAFARLAELPEGDRERPAPDELDLPDELAKLWRVALSCQLASRGGGTPRLAVPQAWDVFGRWLRRYERPVTRAVVDQVIRGAKTDRFALYLYVWRRKGLISADLHDHLLKEAGKCS